MATTTVYRLHWKRRGWTHTKAGPHCFVSRRGALTAARKLEHATQHYLLEPVEELYIEEGTVHWSPHHVDLPDSLREHTVPLGPSVPKGEQWTPELIAVRDRMLSPSAGYTESECTFEAVTAFAKILEES